MGSHACLFGTSILSLGVKFVLLLSLSLLLLEDLLNVELVGDLLLVDWVSHQQHASNNKDGATENDQVIEGA